MDDKNEKRQRVPKLRFPGFTDEWEQRKLGDVFVSLQNNTLSRAELSNQGTAKNVHYGDILVKYGEVLDVRKEQLPRIAEETIADKYKTSFLQSGDIIVADTAEDETVGKCSEIVGLEDDIVIAGLHTIPYRPQVHFGTGYLGYYMNSDAYHRQLLPLMQGIKVTSISKSAMQDTYMVFPKSEDEQSKIGNYFRRLDYLISLHRRKIEDLQNRKKGLLQKMFPQEGKKVPEIRFPGYIDEWEQSKLSSLCEFEKGKGLSKEDLDENGRYSCILYGQLFTDYGMFINKVKSKTDIIEESFKLSESGDILIPRCDTTSDGLGRASSLSLDAVILGFDINILKIKNKRYLDSKFATVALNCHRRDLLSKVVGNTVRHLENKELKDISIEYPREIEEQKKIGSFFQQLDNIITLHQRKLDHLKELKRGLLQQMFV